MMNKLSRLSDLNIEDDILRADFYQIIIKYLSNSNRIVKAKVINPDEEWRHDLVSFRVYGTPDLRWMVGLICGVEDEAKPLPVGDLFYFPAATYIRREMRRFIDEVSQ